MSVEITTVVLVHFI